MAELLKVAKADELSPGPAQCVEVQAKRLVLSNNEGNFYALEDTCADQGGLLPKGAVAGDHVTCPKHVTKFNIRTGRGARPFGAPRHRSLQRSADGDRY